MRADADRWMDWQAVSLNPSIGPAFIQLIRTAPEQRDLATIEMARAEAEKKLVLLNAHLSKTEYVAGSMFTMGDIPLGCSVDRWYKLPLARESHEHVARWYESLRRRAGASQVVQLSLA
jgi:glutathione S-transferase